MQGEARHRREDSVWTRCTCAGSCPGRNTGKFSSTTYLSEEPYFLRMVRVGEIMEVGKEQQI